MQRRVALARAIALDPEMIMYDEPFVGQDPIGLGVLLSLVKQLNKALGLTSLVVSHDLQETLSIADHVIMIANKRVAFQGSPEVMQHLMIRWYVSSFMVVQMVPCVSIFQHHRLGMLCDVKLDCGTWSFDTVPIIWLGARDTDLDTGHFWSFECSVFIGI